MFKPVNFNLPFCDLLPSKVINLCLPFYLQLLFVFAKHQETKMNGELLCCASRWCSTEIPAHSLHRAGVMLVDCAAALGVWPHWVTPVVGSCHPVPGNTCSICDLIQDPPINTQSDLWYIFQFWYAFYTEILQSALRGSWCSVRRIHHCDQHWTLSAHSTESLTATKPLWWGARSEVMKNTSFPGRLISSGTLCWRSFTALHFFMGRCAPCDTWAWEILSWLGLSLCQM